LLSCISNVDAYLILYSSRHSGHESIVAEIGFTNMYNSYTSELIVY